MWLYDHMVTSYILCIDVKLQKLFYKNLLSQKNQTFYENFILQKN